MECKKIKRKRFPKFKAQIRKMPCAMCGGGNWNMVLGQWANTVSHVQTWGAFHDDIENAVPMCAPCHARFEDRPNKERLEYKPLAIKLWNEWQKQS